MVHSCNPSSWEARQKDLKFKVSLSYIVNARSAWAAYQDPISKNPKKQKRIYYLS
jgi:hypothetical protein